MEEPMKILVIEDELDLLQSIGQGLELDGYYVDMVHQGNLALEKLSYEKYDLLILDLNLPDMFGMDILENMPEFNADIKVIILTAHSELEMKILGLDLGASDYMVKPFHFEELEARIRVLFRRNYIVEKKVISCGELKFDTQKRELTGKGIAIKLTKKETAIIEYLMKNQDKCVSAEELLEHAWDCDANCFSNSVRVHLTTLRKKIKEALGYNPIQNKIGEGYFLMENEK